MQVFVDPPRIVGDTVTFRWTQSAVNPFQDENRFSFRFEGINLSQFSQTLFYEIFLGLQLRVFAAYEEPVEVVCPQPIPLPTVLFWTAYHNADRVTVTPIADVGSYSPWVSSTARSRSHTCRAAGVFFGGGKDSLATACLLDEFFGADSVVLFQCVHPFQRGWERMLRLTKRQESLMLRPAQEQLGMVSQRAWTDYMARLRIDGAGSRVRPHFELYSVGLLPAILEWGVPICSGGLTGAAYYVRSQRNGKRSFGYAQSRPEMLAIQSRHYQRVLETDLTITNLTVMLTPIMDFHLLAERYPRGFEQMVMCSLGGPKERWCLRCTKCAEYAFYSLYRGLIDPRFDYNAFFTRSAYIRGLLSYAESGIDLTMFGNAPWQPFLVGGAQYQSFCHAIAQIDQKLITSRLSREAATHLMIVKALFGNARFPHVEMMTTRSVDLLGTDLARSVAGIAANHFPMADELLGPALYGNAPVTYDFAIRMPTRTGLLDQIGEPSLSINAHVSTGG